jgi:site-specific recombinase XerD
LLRDYPETAYVFVRERKAPLTADAVSKIVGRAGREAGIEFPVHPHMLRHATGYKLANDGQDTRAIQHYLGHRKHPAHHPLYRTRVGSVQGLLARLTLRERFDGNVGG